jgi:hypothetical protein
MLFWTIVFFVCYSLIYFVVSQRKMKRMRNSIYSLRTTLNEKNLLIKSKMRKEQFEKEMFEN